jgi:predicted membrane-bound spermidine synthase
MRAAAIFNQRQGRTIIEIGSGLQGPMSGNSILIWSRHTSAKRIIALDLEESHINDVRNATQGDRRVEAIVADGLDYLAKFEDSIDLLYLDFWTPDLAGNAPGTGRQDAYLGAYRTARGKLAEHAMILIDDTDHVHPWKHTLIVPEAVKEGFMEIWQGRQTLLMR